MIKKIIIPAVGAAALSFGFSTAGFADDMSYAPDELSTEHGAMGVYQRMQTAAVKKCDGRLNHDSVIKYRAVRDRCVSDVVDELVHRVNDPRIDKLHAEHKKSV